MKYLVDANVLSEPTKLRPNASVVGWLGQNEADLAIDPIILGEIRFGILIMTRGRRRAMLEEWFERGVRNLSCLAWEAETGHRWAELLSSLRAKGLSMPIKDSLIAATALVHGLTIATRDRVDFHKAGVPVFDPFLP